MEHSICSVRNAAKPPYIDITIFLDYTPYQIVCQVSNISTYWAYLSHILVYYFAQKCGKIITFRNKISRKCGKIFKNVWKSFRDFL